MVSLVAQNPVLLLFGVCAVGFIVGRISLGGFSLGVAAVLFVGIGAGAVSATWVLLEEVWVLGLAVFVYTTGLASGPNFVAAIRRRGLPLNSGAIAAVALAAATVAIAVETIHATGAVGSGIFAGAVTSSPPSPRRSATCSSIRARPRSPAPAPSPSSATRSATPWAS